MSKLHGFLYRSILGHGKMMNVMDRSQEWYMVRF